MGLPAEVGYWLPIAEVGYWLPIAEVGLKKKVGYWRRGLLLQLEAHRFCWFGRGGWLAEGLMVGLCFAPGEFR